ncbi:cell division protein FtsL [Alcaligenes faecalis]|uniref:cell division protein FtsL n=1 Tax=Alcaligenes faecalis TaxID=511 RepID=UPI0010CA28FF|nr:cell division protein FtsL [Alcaligenes faecalis]QCP83604.1 cell division protein FtsL [Alcaligenes faecalis]
MMRLVITLSLVLMLSAISLVTARYQARELFVQTDRLATKAGELDTDWRRLQLERAELARNARVDDIGRNELGLVLSSPERTLYLQGGELSSTQVQSGGRP